MKFFEAILNLIRFCFGILIPKKSDNLDEENTPQVELIEEQEAQQETRDVLEMIEAAPRQPGVLGTVGQNSLQPLQVQIPRLPHYQGLYGFHLQSDGAIYQVRHPQDLWDDCPSHEPTLNQGLPATDDTSSPPPSPEDKGSQTLEDMTKSCLYYDPSWAQMFRPKGVIAFYKPEKKEKGRSFLDYFKKK